MIQVRLASVMMLLAVSFMPLTSRAADKKPKFELTAADWPQEMGPTRTGYTPEQPVVKAWPASGPTVLWNANVGYGSSPVAVADGRVFTFGAFKAGVDLKTGVTPEKVAWHGFHGAGGGNAAKPDEGTPAEEGISCWVFCFNETDGKLLWTTRIADNVDTINSIDWSHASPLVADGRVFVHTYYGTVAALEAKSGKLLWTVNLSDVGMTRYHTKAGNMCSPLLLPGGKAVALSYGVGSNGNVSEMQTAAFAVESGKLLWRSEKLGEGFRANQSSLFLAELEGKPTILFSTGGALAGLNPADGSTRWKNSFEDIFPDFGLIRKAYRGDKELARKLFEKQVPGGGDAEWKKFQDGIGTYGCAYPNRMPMAWNDHIIDHMYIWHQMKDSKTFGLRMEKGEPLLAWRAPELCETRGYFVLHDGKVYGMDHQEQDGGFNRPDGGFFLQRPYHQRPQRPVDIKQFQCYDIATGKLLWSSDVLTRGNPEEGTNLYSGSGRFILAGDHVILWGRAGLRVARILPKGGLEMVAEYAQTSSYPSIPVLANGRLYLRKLNPNSDPKRDPFFNDGKGANLIALDLSPEKQKSKVE